jgi:predicted nucleotide-binding protein (sugar kinase/HSP70/actin superfamily)
VLFCSRREKANYYPSNFVEIAAREVWRPRNPPRAADPIPARGWTRAARERIALMQKRSSLRVGMPRVLNMYVYTPFFSAYLESLGVPTENLVYSDYTSRELYRSGAGRGAIDPCFPSKIGIPHVYNLIYTKHAKKPLDVIFFPMIDVLRRSPTGSRNLRPDEHPAGCETPAALPFPPATARHTRRRIRSSPPAAHSPASSARRS